MLKLSEYKFDNEKKLISSLELQNNNVILNNDGYENK
jgi:hypothetical protein